MPGERDWSVEVGTLVEQLTTYYLFPDVAERVAELLRRRLAEGAYGGLADEAAFAVAVTEDTMSASNDQHLRLRHSVARLAERDEPVVPESGRHPDEARLSGHGFRRVEVLAGNVGVLDIRRLFPTSMSGHVAVAAMHLVADADALIIDVRSCMGGEPDMVALVSSFLFDERTHLTDLYFPASDTRLQYWTSFVAGPRFGGRKPIYVLTSSQTISAGEGLSYDLQQLGRAVLVGEVTAGAANFDYRYRVNGHLMFSVPSGYPVNPISGSGWEGVGVLPDVAVPAGLAFTVAHKAALEHVIRLGAEGHRCTVYDEAVAALRELDGIAASP